MAERTTPCKTNLFTTIKNNFFNKQKLKTAFKVWLFLAVLKAIGFMLVWFGFATLIHNTSGGGGSPIPKYISVDILDDTNSVPHVDDQNALCSLLKMLEVHGNKSQLEQTRKLIQDGSISHEDLDYFISLGNLLEKVKKPGASTQIELDQASGKSAVPLFRLKPGTRLSLTKAIIKTRKKDMHTTESHNKPTELLQREPRNAWAAWRSRMTGRKLYDDGDITDRLTYSLATESVVSLRNPASTTNSQFRMLLKLHDASEGVFKPMRLVRTYERNADVHFFHDIERHHADIAAFHLDRIIGLHRVPPTVGRLVNISRDIEPHSDMALKRTIYLSETGHKCIYGTCETCHAGNPVCGQDGGRDVIEGSITIWLPSTSKSLKTKTRDYPWRRSLMMHADMDWQVNERFCEQTKLQTKYGSSRQFLDLLDIAVFDYLIGNPSRQTYHTLSLYGNNSAPILTNNALGFGSSSIDDPLILKPISQCCMIRHSTLSRLIRLSSGSDLLSIQMKRSLARDPLSSGSNGPVLTEDHLASLDRRVHKIMDLVWTCVQDQGAQNVILDDGF